MDRLPRHLQKYIVEQDYTKYTPIDHAVWRFILRQLKAFLSIHAHPSYLDGLEKTGIGIESIPKISDISEKLKPFGWRALPVSGFIPPAAFMELQALSVLPIASDMRTLDHLLYTPAPDIVHEAAGHAPLLIDPEFAAYLRQYAQVAKKAIISKEDLELYEAIRVLSDTKEDPESSPEVIASAQKRLDQVSSAMTHISEAAELARMNWWTAEYGLIGNLENPKIYGAGLLSSVGESRWCLDKKVKKIPLTVDCIKTTYDITEPQPQLFVTPDFPTLGKVLEQMANRMAFRVGGLEGLGKALRAGTVNTVELNSGLQISGQLEEILQEPNSSLPVYLRFSGPCQLAYNDHELAGHDKGYHSSGYGTPLGDLKLKPGLCPSLISDEELAQIGVFQGKKSIIEFHSGLRVEGTPKAWLRQDGKLVLMSLQDCKVTYFSRVLFQPEWGVFDLAFGSKVVSVFGGPADRVAYGALEDFVAQRVRRRTFSEEEQLHVDLYAQVRQLRELSKKQLNQESQYLDQVRSLFGIAKNSFSKDWLLQLELLEIAQHLDSESEVAQELISSLRNLAKLLEKSSSVINDGLALANHL
jgi:phenylalanine-4-hydroxylase